MIIFQTVPFSILSQNIGLADQWGQICYIKIWNFRQQNWKKVAEYDEGEGVTNILVTEEEEEERENIVEL